LTSPGKLPKAIKAYRIGDAQGEYPVFSAEGARQVSGRWSEKGQEVIYTSEYYSTALLEKLAYLGEIPANQHYVEITIPTNVTFEVVTDASLPGWYESNANIARIFGSGWYKEARSAILIAPSVIARLDSNIVINTRHKDFAKIRHGLETPISWDDRLFSPGINRGQ
jgi:RES domain-containing protein